MPAYLFQAPTGVPGAVTRPDESNAEPIMLQTPYPTVYGQALVYTTGGAAAWGTGNVQADFAGALVRVAPSISGSISTDATFSGGQPLTTQVQSILVRGYMSVTCQYGTPARGGIVYVNIQATGTRVVGGFEATYQSSYNVALTTTQAEWATDGMDASLNAEIRIAR